MLTLTTQQISLLLYLVQDTAANYVRTLQHKPELANDALDCEILTELAALEEALSMSLAPERDINEQLH